jgi:hypothetical protein
MMPTDLWFIDAIARYFYTIVVFDERGSIIDKIMLTWYLNIPLRYIISRAMNIKVKRDNNYDLRWKIIVWSPFQPLYSRFGLIRNPGLNSKSNPDLNFNPDHDPGLQSNSNPWPQLQL